MAVIGKVTPTRDGGWQGTIRTLCIDTKVRLVPNDNQEGENAPAFRIFAGHSELGAAWKHRTIGESPKEYLSLRLDDPSLPEPLAAAMFESTDGKEARIIWSRD